MFLKRDICTLTKTCSLAEIYGRFVDMNWAIKLRAWAINI